MTISPTLAKFLSLLGFSEGTTTSSITQNDGYDVIVSGVDGPETFTDYSDHPFAHGRPSKLIRPEENGRPAIYSSASGRYQIELWIWRAYKPKLGLQDFSPASQDAVAAQLIGECHAIQPILAGDIEKAIELCNSRWASLPGNTDGQGGKSMDDLLDQWTAINA
jgi:muramidase (phage lysozyme)